LAISLPLEPMVVLVDAAQFEQALLNLLVNARHAMPDGGRVELDVERVELREDSAWPEAEPGAYVRLSVADSGTGMDEATRSRVFEPFFTTKALGYGTGLGLSTVHGLTKQAGGYIRVASEPGRGSRFELVLPRHAVPAPEATRSDAMVWSPGSGTVLLVEDQPRVRRSLERILEDAGYQVIAAEDGEQALELARRREGRIDLLVSDVIMPGLSGICIRFTEACSRGVARRSDSGCDDADLSPQLAARSPRSCRAVRPGSRSGPAPWRGPWGRDERVCVPRRAG